MLSGTGIRTLDEISACARDDNHMMKGIKIVTLLPLSVIFATTTGLVSDGYNELISYSGSYTNDILSGKWTSIHKKL